MNTILSLTNLAYHLNSVKLLSDIHLDINEGEILAVVGPNGASKTTLLKILSNDITPTKGEVCFDNIPLADISKIAFARSLAVLPQFSLLNFPYTVEEVVALGRIPHCTGKKIDAQIVDAAIDRLDISYLKGKEYTKLSGGEKQRTQIARVLTQIWRKEDAKHRVLLLDEPTSSLDLGHQQQLMAQIKAFAEEGVAVVMVVHDINIAAKYADKIVALACGKVQFSGSTTDVLNEEQLSQLFNADLKIIVNQHTGQSYVCA